MDMVLHHNYTQLLLCTRDDTGTVTCSVCPVAECHGGQQHTSLVDPPPQSTALCNWGVWSHLQAFQNCHLL
ncbi:hypothetical protein DPMN_027035 [Dreissena polymorpha]|uniref:Uncharacterized protein n=1 Tax=Dreissena polymorpha TaxID=45954 RepID=A0A9D4IC58_DREPO|nr:hypothetical protein DPMN_171145 [Dreissena polymorpha]KAH3769866.1 hypothetical protein DPMN_171147 [Dreissena polymorpha]KAH3864023.1 hypothetical protein DPMN_027035 [Dreissena polymorpha]